MNNGERILQYADLRVDSNKTYKDTYFVKEKIVLRWRQSRKNASEMVEAHFRCTFYLRVFISLLPLSVGEIPNVVEQILVS